MTLLDVSQKLFGGKPNNYSAAKIASTENDTASVLYGTAQVDADSGEVEVLIDGTEIPTDPDDPDYGLASTMTCDTEELIQAGDRVTVVRNGQNAKAIVLSPDSTGAAAAQQAADEAKAVAEATGQHFWHRDTNPDGAGAGAFITDETQADFTAAAADGFSDYDPSTKPYRNVLMNSLGFIIREALHNLASFTQSAVAFFDGNGNVTAGFGSNGFQVGQSNESHLTGDYHSLQLIDKNNNTYFHVSDLRDTTGYASLTETFEGDGSSTDFQVSFTPKDAASSSVTVDGVSSTFTLASETFTLPSAPSDGSVVLISYKTSDEAIAFTFGNRTGGIGAYSSSFGRGNEASGVYAHAEGRKTKATNYESHAEGYGTTASGNVSHAEGNLSIASGGSSHAEGNSTIAEGHVTHAEGYRTQAGSNYSHAEGWNSKATGQAAHAEGQDTYARGNASHAQNIGTIATNAQTAIGKYNVSDYTSAFIVGNGTDANNRSNALTVAWNGDVVTAGGITASGDVTAAEVVTEKVTASGSSLEISADTLDITATNLNLTGSWSMSLGGKADTAWEYLTGNATATNYCRWRCKMGVVYVEIHYSSGAAIPTTGSKTFGTILDGYRPTRTATVAAYHATNNCGAFWVDPDGTVKARTVASSAQGAIHASVCYPL